MASSSQEMLPGLCWPAAQAAEALWVMARALGWAAAERPLIAPPLGDASPAQLDATLPTLAAALGLSAEGVETGYAEAATTVRDIAPAVLSVARTGGPELLLVLARRGGWLHVLTPDGSIQKVSLARVRAAIFTVMEAPYRGQAAQLASRTGLGERKRDELAAALVREQLRDRRIFVGWLLRRAPRRSLWQQARAVGAVRLLVGFLIVYAGQFALGAATLFLAGNAALSGRLDRGYMLGWMLLIFTMVPLQSLGGWLQGRLAITIGLESKRRLLHGILNQDGEQTRHRGYGHFLGQVIEAETVELSLFSGSLLALTAVTELSFAAIAVTTGSGQLVLALLLFVWVGFVAVASWRYYQAAQVYTTARLAMTHATIEQMMGHRTRLAQLPATEWHKEEEDGLLAYQTLCQTLDRRTRVLTSLVAPSFLLVGFLAILPAWVNAGLSAAQVALSIAGLLFAYQALAKLASNIPMLAGAIISWQKARLLFNNIVESTSPVGMVQRQKSTPGKVLLQARGVGFRYAPTTPLVLDGCELTIRAGERILLEGPSGGGKSTLMAMLAGLQQPTAGLLLLDGLDHFSVGLPAWRRRVVAAPQFHENHVLAESLAFNLLLGRGWPPAAGDLAEAEAVCHELGLSPLLQRMPAGLHQVVGDSGWQLSHGEKSRIYIARALLQRAELVVLDESFAALDPETLVQALRCVQRRASTLLVIAHP